MKIPRVWDYGDLGIVDPFLISGGTRGRFAELNDLLRAQLKVVKSEAGPAIESRGATFHFPERGGSTAELSLSVEPLERGGNSRRDKVAERLLELLKSGSAPVAGTQEIVGESVLGAHSYRRQVW